MSSTHLDTPFLDGGIRSTNFFNGRILSREDMQREQDAERAIHERLGVAVGDGIAWGFQVLPNAIGGVSLTNPVVTVRAGLAINRRGQTLALDRDVDVSLLAPAPQNPSIPTPMAGAFGECEPPDDSVYVTGTGVYLLAVAPARAKQGLALVSGLGNEAAACNAKEVIDGVQFRLFTVKLSQSELADDVHLRNVAAYKFFFAAGAAEPAVRDPFGIATTPPALTDPPLTECDVPLALLQWTELGGLRWVDLWSVRRRLTHRPIPGIVPLGADDPKQDAMGEAMVLQFSEQIQTHRLLGQSSMRASDAFRWLPPIGLLPLGGLPGAVGFDSNAFFNGFTTRGPLYMEGARLRPLLKVASEYPPIIVGDPELVWLYFVRENRMPQNGVTPTQPYLVFALGRVPCQVVPRFDVSHWDFANYALEDDL